MQVIDNLKKLQAYLSQNSNPQNSVGFVPTMGALHQGHLSLINQSTTENSLTVCSIFVNPTQFNNPQDLEKYPRTLEADWAQLAKTKVNVLYLPKVKELYPQGLKSQTYDFGPIAQQMEGAFRPGHFDGVGTVVEALFAHVKPNKAYFGEKDFQQLQIIRKLVAIQDIPTQIIPVPIYREQNGLAMSSRNQRLDEESIAQSGFIYQMLCHIKQNIQTQSWTDLYDEVSKKFAQSVFDLEYLYLANEADLVPCQSYQSDQAQRIFVAAFAKEVRLIDNMAL
jgi:pantoate--beta-alanine ligase